MDREINDQNYIKKDLMKILESEENRKSKIQKELRRMPKGNLLIKKASKGLGFYEKTKNYQHGIKKNEERIRLFARKCYLKTQAAICADNIDALKLAVKYLENKKVTNRKELRPTTYNRMKQMLNINDYLYSKEELDWIKGSYETNPYKREYLKYMTKSGITVRTKSERFIADLLTEYGILYRYEAKFKTGGRTYYPDFTIMTEDGRTVLWEHFGLMDDSDYLKSSYERVENYRKAGFTTHRNLICTYEDDMISEDILDEIIHRYLM